MSPVTRDFVNPEKPWPHIERLAAATARAGKLLQPRLPVYPRFVAAPPGEWLHADPLACATPYGQATEAVQPAAASEANALQLPAQSAAASLYQTSAQLSVYARVQALADATGLSRASDWVAGAAHDTASETQALNALQDAPSFRSSSATQALENSLRAAPAPVPGEQKSFSQQDNESPESNALSKEVEVAQQHRSRRPRWHVRTDVWGGLEGAPQPQPSPALSRLLGQISDLHTAAQLASAQQTSAHESNAAVQLAAILGSEEIQQLLAARGGDAKAVCAAADKLRAAMHGDRVSYVVNRNINYTNMCTFGCGFCAFSKGRVADELRGAPYLLGCAHTVRCAGFSCSQVCMLTQCHTCIRFTPIAGCRRTACTIAYYQNVMLPKGYPMCTLMPSVQCRLDEVQRRVAEAWDRGASEVCLQGGIHPDFTGSTYLDILRACKEAAPGIHVHAFSPLEVSHGAATLGVSTSRFLSQLRDAGLGSLPGTAAEVLTDRVRNVVCPDKLSASKWLQVVGDAHDVGLRTTSTIMFGHVDGLQDWAEHLVALRYPSFRISGSLTALCAAACMPVYACVRHSAVHTCATSVTSRM